ncbi:MAG: hypothetical protein RLO38_11285 [Roseovarius confluentis]
MRLAPISHGATESKKRAMTLNPLSIGQREDRPAVASETRATLAQTPETRVLEHTPNLHKRISDGQGAKSLGDATQKRQVCKRSLRE